MKSGPCFWDNFEPTAYIFCEEQICGFITQPANTWSNIGYLIVAILIYRSRDKDPRIRTYFFWANLSLFLGSTFFHASSTYLGKFLDVSAMFFVSVTILSVALERTFDLSRKKTLILFFALLTLSLSFLYIMRFGNVLFASQILISGWLEWKLVDKKTGIDVSKLKLAIATLMIAFMIWLLDVFKILCHPGNHILTGHGIWHLLTAYTNWIFFTAYKSESK